MIITEEIKSRFFNKVKKGENEYDCWTWIGGTGSFGHGRFKFNNKTEGAHRVSYTIFNGQIEPGLLVCHKCDVPQCVNPKHLFLGTYSDNMQDCISKGRFKFHINVKDQFKIGNKNSAVLSDEVVIEIKKRLLIKDNQRKIAEDFGVKYQTVRDISAQRSYYNIKI